jgi:hypothetical protein
MYLNTQHSGLLLIVSLLFSNLIFAQLTVRNDQYIFAKDEVIFVNNEVNLVNTNSKIYLRDEAQLVQGNGTSGNSGIGELSAQQNGTVNAFSYNYWCAPVGNIDANDTVNRPFRVNQIDESTGIITSTDAQFTNSHNGNSSPLTISNSWLWTFVASTNYAEWVHVGSSGDIAPGLGFTMKGTDGSGDNQRYDFRGKPNNGTITNTVTTSEWTLIGNPYPSAMDALDFIHDPQNAANITGTLYYWEQAAGQTSHFVEDYIGGYAAYTIASDGTPTFVPATFSAYTASGDAVALPIPQNGVKIARRYIPIAQGFMVEGAANGLVYTKNSHRDYYKQSNADSYFFGAEGLNDNSQTRTNETDNQNDYGLAIVPETYKRFRLNIILNDTYTRQLVQNFHSSATDGFDYGLESKSPEGVASDAYWTQDNTPFVIQAHNYALDLRIPLVLKLEEQQPITISIFDIQRFDDAQAIYLHDIETNTYVDLRTQNFTINLEAGVYEERFEVTFEQENTLSDPEVTFEGFNIIQNNSTAELVIQNPNQLDIINLQLYDTAGKQIMSHQNIGNHSSMRFSTKQISSGVYISTATTKDQQTLTKKIIIK